MTASPPGFVVLHRLPDGRWELLGEVQRKRGLPARAARRAAILEATRGTRRARLGRAGVARAGVGYLRTPAERLRPGACKPGR